MGYKRVKAIKRDGVIYEFRQNSQFVYEAVVSGFVGPHDVEEIRIHDQIGLMGYWDVTAIEAGVFQGLKNLKRVRLPFGLQTIGERAFKGCSSLESIVPSFFPFSEESFIPTWNRIGREAFDGTSLKQIVLLRERVILEDHCFANCEHLQEVKYPGSIQLGRSVFDCKMDHIAYGGNWYILKRQEEQL